MLLSGIDSLIFYFLCLDAKKQSFEMTVMIVTFFNASGIDSGNFLDAHLRSEILPPNYVTSAIASTSTNSVPALARQSAPFPTLLDRAISSTELKLTKILVSFGQFCI
jgi:hypothetical protein